MILGCFFFDLLIDWFIFDMVSYKQGWPHLQLPVQLRITLIFSPPHSHSPISELLGLQSITTKSGTEPRALCMLSQHSAKWATAPEPFPCFRSDISPNISQCQIKILSLAAGCGHLAKFSLMSINEIMWVLLLSVLFVFVEKKNSHYIT